MAEIIRMPRMSDTMEEGNIVGWLKKVGDSVEPGDVLAEVETDKATMELESYQEGVLLYIGVKEGTIPVNGILAVIGEKGEDYKEALAEAEKETPVQSTNGTEDKKETKVIADEAGSVPVVSNEIVASESRIKASPLAKSIAAQAGVSLGNIEGSGDHGRIIKRDIENYLKSMPQSMPAPQITRVENPEVEYGDHGISQMRKIIAKRLGESKFTSPHFYLTIEINMDNASSSRKDINADPDTKVSFNDFVVKASAMALRKHPMVNASWMGDKIRIHRDINIGVAVAVAEGLLVPVVNNADYKSFSEINKEVKYLAGLAKERKLQPEQMQGNTFTISNLGMFGIEEFTAIINPPDACILAVGAIIEKPIVLNGEIKAAKMMKVTLSCDHRIVDGATGAQFLGTLKKNLENPVNMLV